MQLVQIWECPLMIDKEYMSPCSDMCTELMQLLWRASGIAPQRAVADNVSRNAGAPHAGAFWRGAQAACNAGAPDDTGAVATAPDALPRTAAALSSAPCWQTSPSRRVWFCGVPWAWGERGCRLEMLSQPEMSLLPLHQTQRCSCTGLVHRAQL